MELQDNSIFFSPSGFWITIPNVNIFACIKKQKNKTYTVSKMFQICYLNVLGFKKIQLTGPAVDTISYKVIQVDVLFIT